MSAELEASWPPGILPENRLKALQPLSKGLRRFKVEKLTTEVSSSTTAVFETYTGTPMQESLSQAG